MKTIAKRLWEEPAYFTSTVAAAGVVLLQIVSWPDAVEIPLSAAFVLLGGHVTRQLSRPVKREP